MRFHTCCHRCSFQRNRWLWWFTRYVSRKWNGDIPPLSLRICAMSLFAVDQDWCLVRLPVLTQVGSYHLVDHPHSYFWSNPLLRHRSHLYHLNYHHYLSHRFRSASFNSDQFFFTTPTVPRARARTRSKSLCPRLPLVHHLSLTTSLLTLTLPSYLWRQKISKWVLNIYFLGTILTFLKNHCRVYARTRSYARSSRKLQTIRKVVITGVENVFEGLKELCGGEDIDAAIV